MGFLPGRLLLIRKVFQLWMGFFILGIPLEYGMGLDSISHQYHVCKKNPSLPGDAYQCRLWDFQKRIFLHDVKTIRFSIPMKDSRIFLVTIPGQSLSGYIALRKTTVHVFRGKEVLRPHKLFFHNAPLYRIPPPDKEKTNSDLQITGGLSGIPFHPETILSDLSIKKGGENLVLEELGIAMIREIALMATLAGLILIFIASLIFFHWKEFVLYPFLFSLFFIHLLMVTHGYESLATMTRLGYLSVMLFSVTLPLWIKTKNTDKRYFLIPLITIMGIFLVLYAGDNELINYTLIIGFILILGFGSYTLIKNSELKKTIVIVQDYFLYSMVSILVLVDILGFLSGIPVIYLLVYFLSFLTWVTVLFLILRVNTKYAVCRQKYTWLQHFLPSDKKLYLLRAMIKKYSDNFMQHEGISVMGVVLILPEKYKNIHLTQFRKKIKNGNELLIRLLDELFAQKLDLFYGSILKFSENPALSVTHIQILTNFNENDYIFFLPLHAQKKIIGLMAGIVPRNRRDHFSMDIFMIIQKMMETSIASQLSRYQLRAINQGLESKISQRTRELTAKTNELEKMNHWKTDFFAKITHDIKTPLSLLTMPIDTLLKKKDKLNKEQVHLLDIIKSSSYRVISMINNTLDHSRLEGDKMQIILIYSDINHFIRQISEVYENIIGFNNMEFIRIIPETPMYLFFDPEKIEKILNNLLGNAIKYNRPEKKITLSIKISTGKYWILVRDEGHGIADEFMDSIFSAYTQIQDPDKIFYSGSGLGLSNVKEMIALHGGDASVKSQPGQYTEIGVYIPIKTDEESEIVDVDISNITYLQKERWISYIHTIKNQEKLSVLIAGNKSELQKSLGKLLSMHFDAGMAPDDFFLDNPDDAGWKKNISTSHIAIFIFGGEKNGAFLSRVRNLLSWYEHRNLYLPSIGFIPLGYSEEISDLFDEVIYYPAHDMEILEKIKRLHQNTRKIIRQKNQ